MQRLISTTSKVSVASETFNYLKAHDTIGHRGDCVGQHLKDW